MKKFFQCFHLSKPSKKVRGDALMMSLLFSVLVLMVSVGLARFLAQDLFFVRTILFSEKAYFTAESGLEDTLLQLQENPLTNIVDAPIVVGGNYEATVSAINLVPKIETNIMPSQTKRFRFERGLPSRPVVDDFSVEVQGSGAALWRVVCRKNAAITGESIGTVSISGSFAEGSEIESFRNEFGRVEDIKEDTNGNREDVDSYEDSVGNFFDLVVLTEEEQKSCYLNVQNVSGDPLFLGLENLLGLAPEAVSISSKGVAGKKQKTLHYVFGQKTLTSFFDFGFLLSE